MTFKYNACVLLAALTLTGCAPSIIGLAAGAGASVGIAAEREGGMSTAASDVRIRALISDKWFKYNLETFAKLNLTVDEGRVLITGIVQNPDARVEAVRLAWQVEGVTQVINEIRIADSQSFPDQVRDTWITTRLRTELTFDGNVQAINYSIDTVDGIVYLMGIAASQSELDHVIDRARAIPHVKQVISYVKQIGTPVPATASPQATKYIPDGAHAGTIAPSAPPLHGQASYAEPDADTHEGGQPQTLTPPPSSDAAPPNIVQPDHFAPPPNSASDDMSGGSSGAFRPEPVEQQSLQPPSVQQQPLH